MIGSKKLGDIGEQMAERVYAEDGFQILETNFRCRSGEIDIIAEKDFCFHYLFEEFFLASEIVIEKCQIYSCLFCNVTSSSTCKSFFCKDFGCCF